ncbi:hypothetical protein BR93DRAFT_442340 [Coniochaeta sp. PMI_546]|nr:hypothetical protein BR93DRAFT_442340 [Coniochaeta sp. PMI_546]
MLKAISSSAIGIDDPDTSKQRSGSGSRSDSQEMERASLALTHHGLGASQLSAFHLIATRQAGRDVPSCPPGPFLGSDENCKVLCGAIQGQVDADWPAKYRKARTVRTQCSPQSWAELAKSHWIPRHYFAQGNMKITPQHAVNYTCSRYTVLIVVSFTPCCWNHDIVYDIRAQGCSVGSPATNAK